MKEDWEHELDATDLEKMISDLDFSDLDYYQYRQDQHKNPMWEGGCPVHGFPSWIHRDYGCVDCLQELSDLTKKENKMVGKRDAATEAPRALVWDRLDRVNEKVKFLQEVTLQLTVRLEPVSQPVSQPVSMKEEGRFAEDTSDLPEMAKRLHSIHESLEVVADAMLYAIQRLEI
jgi:tetrahydromethanopterin S-methyltransferase subunit G